MAGNHQQILTLALEAKMWSQPHFDAFAGNREGVAVSAQGWRNSAHALANAVPPKGAHGPLGMQVRALPPASFVQHCGESGRALRRSSSRQKLHVVRSMEPPEVKDTRLSWRHRNASSPIAILPQVGARGRVTFAATIGCRTMTQSGSHMQVSAAVGSGAGNPGLRDRHSVRASGAAGDYSPRVL